MKWLVKLAVGTPIMFGSVVFAGDDSKSLLDHILSPGNPVIRTSRPQKKPSVVDWQKVRDAEIRKSRLAQYDRQIERFEKDLQRRVPLKPLESYLPFEYAEQGSISKIRRTKFPHTTYANIGKKYSELVYIQKAKSAFKYGRATPTPLEQGRDSWKRIQQLETALVETEEELFNKLDKAIASISLRSLEGDLKALKALRQIVDQLGSTAEIVVGSHKMFESTSKEYLEELAISEKIFLKLVEICRDTYAAEEPYDELKEQYLLQSELYGKLAVRVRKRKEKITPEIAVVLENLAYAKRSKLLLDRTSVSLEPFEGLVETGQEAEKFLRITKTYVKHFKRLKSSIHSLHAKLHEVEDELADLAAPPINQKPTNTAKKPSTR